ncbi:MAG: hypothetical protein FJ100_23200 [Deltaproteobacteria bacterium]|nr:hypothetical protein [Deltaproteobacteria bacterium]
MFTGLTHCDDGNVCTNDGCDPKTGCKFVHNDGPCEAKACTWGDKCQDGACKAGTVGRYFEARLSGKDGGGKPSVAYGNGGDAYQNGDVALCGFQGGYSPWNWMTARFGPDGKVKWQLNGSSNSTHNYLTACAVSQSQALGGRGLPAAGKLTD